MNIERINALADLIEKQPHTEWRSSGGFNMSNYFHSCGTPSCIAGWAAAMAVSEFGELARSTAQAAHKGERDYRDVIPEAFLGIPPEVGAELFAPDDLIWSSISPAQAAATLRHLAKTGEVDWFASHSKQGG